MRVLRYIITIVIMIAELLVINMFKIHVFNDDIAMSYNLTLPASPFIVAVRECIVAKLQQPNSIS